jgi:hypothetical protein
MADILPDLILVVFSVIVGSACGYLSSLALERRKEKNRLRDNAMKEMHVLILIMREVWKGIHRCESLLKHSKELALGKGLTKIDTVLGDVWIKDIIPVSNDYLTLGFIYDIYDKFTLININIDKDNTAAAVQFTQEHLPGIKKNFDRLQRAMKKKVEDGAMDITFPEYLQRPVE